jgi:RNA polymerase sigma-70 factor, ECF subfamily
METDDLRDWQAFCNGDNAAMERLFVRLSPALFSYCLYLCGNRASSEEIVQESYLRLLAQRSNGKITSSVRSWLFVTARNLLLNLSRGHPHQSLDDLPENYLVNDRNPDANLQVSRILSRLTPEDRELLLLREHQGFSINEIAKMLNLSAENIRVRLYRLRKRIQEDERQSNG